MTDCGKIRAGGANVREILGVMHGRLLSSDRPERAGKALLSHRFAYCVRASKCRRLCPRLVKGPGVNQVACVNIKTGEKRPLYESLEDPAFECPEGLF